MTVVMKITPVLPGRPLDDKAWTYLKYVDFNAYEGRGLVASTLDRSEAMKFNNIAEGITFWQTMSTTHPVRNDGKPNRPLTAYHATFETVT